MNFKTPMVRLGFVAASTALAVAAWAAPAQANPSAPWIGYGQTNTYNGVRCVQHLINSLYMQTNYHQVAEDGIFGPDTAGAIKAYQQSEHLDVDGIVGPTTGTALIIATYGGNGTGCDYYVPTRY
ncbi:peptidoglycan-binding domain-containing protein [Streptomyces sp. LMG1-1-1.1]|uniref:peptidoglycan-binding domain-containing protein n=1 Tax=Streptomyces sp. LMG1-1-1.1 TaxID=3135245 RepID=UPI0034661AEC